jgi:hypothetical protein
VCQLKRTAASANPVEPVLFQLEGDEVREYNLWTKHLVPVGYFVLKCVCYARHLRAEKACRVVTQFEIQPDV